MNRVSAEKSDVVTGEDAESSKKTESEAQLLAKPLFIYVTDGSTEGAYDKIEKVVLDDNKVLIGMKAFKCVKMSPSDVNDDPLLSGRSRDDRYFLFVSRDQSKVSVVDGSKMKAKGVYNAMKKHASKDYSTKFDKNVKAMQKLLLEFDKINNSVKVLNEKKQRLGSDISKGESKKIEKELAELSERQKKADAMRDELSTYKLKGEKKSA